MRERQRQAVYAALRNGKMVFDGKYEAHLSRSCRDAVNMYDRDTNADYELPPLVNSVSDYMGGLRGAITVS